MFYYYKTKKEQQEQQQIKQLQTMILKINDTALIMCHL